MTLRSSMSLRCHIAWDGINLRSCIVLGSRMSWNVNISLIYGVSLGIAIPLRPHNLADD